ncbi:MAG: HAMP domain-containing sensor histidine kinase, partial [Cyanobacteria bacterium P01_F01_bin.153]
EESQGKTYSEIEANPNVITITTHEQDGHIQVQIQDNGVGMVPKTIKLIFEQGFTTKAVGKGTGLGMAIARQIVEEKHGGTITCTSKLAEGTLFIIKLPV